MTRFSLTRYNQTGTNKPYAEACERNQQPILSIIKDVFTEAGSVLEIGSGTGQHAIYFARHLPHIHWQPSDVAENLAGITAWVNEAGLPNVKPPIELDINKTPWPVPLINGVFTANTAHIMSWPEVIITIHNIGRILSPGGFFCLYGPFNYQGAYTSDSNASFDQRLKSRDPDSGIRDFEDIETEAHKAGLNLFEDHAMPANNRLLIWQKIADS